MKRVIQWLVRMKRQVRFALTVHPAKVAQLWREQGVSIGEETYIYRDVKLGRGGRDPIVVGRRCVLTGCMILGHDASTNRALGLQYGDHSMVQPVVIEDECFIGAGAIVLMGVTVGKGSIIGAGAIVTSDVPAGSVVGGNPARVICSVEELVERRKRLGAEHPEFFPDKPCDLDSEL